MEDARDAVGVGVGVHVGHGVGGQSDVVAELVGVAGGGFDAGAGGYADDDELGDAEIFEVMIEAGVGEGSPCALGYGVVGGLLVEFGDEIGPSGREVAGAGRLFGAAGGSGVDVDENYWEVFAAEGFG